mmetsp:Transcript_30980/g.58033  ORF Transcript_30980/g.58033 Transcript_30980/m.58033 type:complete len:212 (+) Transcript_30980:392-1027(+)
MNAVLVEDVIIIRSPIRFKRIDDFLHLFRRQAGLAQVKCNLWPITKHLFHDWNRTVLDVVRIEILNAMNSNTHMWDERQRLSHRCRQDVCQRPSNFVHCCKNTGWVCHCILWKSWNGVNIPELLEEASLLHRPITVTSDMSTNGFKVIECCLTCRLLVFFGSQARCSCTLGLLCSSSVCGLGRLEGVPLHSRSENKASISLGLCRKSYSRT